MALGDLTPLTALNASTAAPTSAGNAPPAAAATTTATVVPASMSAFDLEAAARKARAQDRVRCRRHATMRQMVSLLIYLGTLLVIAIYSLFCFWPRPTPSEKPAAAAVQGAAAAHSRPFYLPCDVRDVDTLLTSVASDTVRAQMMIGVCYLHTPMVIWKETQLVFLVVFAGALGALLSSLRKSTAHFYKGDLCAEGLPGFYVWPPSGAIIGLVFYVFIRGGFFSGQSDVSQTSTYSFIAWAMLAGMFMHEAIAKLKKVAVALLTKADTRLPEPASGGSSATTASTAVAPAGGDATRDAGERGAIPFAPAAGASPPGTVG